MSEDIEYDGDYDIDDQVQEPVKADRVDIKFSASLIEDYRSCPAKAFARITRQEPLRRDISLCLGSSVHTALERFVTHREDPVKTFNKEFKAEADRNKILTTTDDAQTALTSGLECVGSGIGILKHTGPSGIPLYKRLDPEYIERHFDLRYRGRRIVGKIDFVTFLDDGNYLNCDWKTGKKAPSPEKLACDIQFSIYGWATMNDPAMPKTVGKSMLYGVYLHLRGQSNERHEKSGKRKSLRETKDKKNIQYDFQVKRTAEQIERHMQTIVEPVMLGMESGVWYRNDQGTFANPCSWCGHYDREKQRCNAEIPADGTNKFPMRPTAAQLVEQLPGTQTGMLFGPEVIDQSKAAQLKPYSEEQGEQS